MLICLPILIKHFYFQLVCSFQNEHENYTRFKEFELHTLEFDSHPKHNRQHDWGDLYDHLIYSKIFTSIMDMIHIQAPKTMKESGDTFDLDSAKHLILIACFMS